MVGPLPIEQKKSVICCMVSEKYAALCLHTLTTKKFSVPAVEAVGFRVPEVMAGGTVRSSRGRWYWIDCPGSWPDDD